MSWAGIGSDDAGAASAPQDMLEASAGPAIFSGGRTRGAPASSKGLVSRSPVSGRTVSKKQGRRLGLYGSAAVLAGLIVFVGLRRRD